MENGMDRYLGQILDNRYELLEIIGTGGMAVVFKALCHRLNRYVAVKILKDEFARDDEFREHFKAESQAVAMLSHPNIVGVYDFSKTYECQYIVMELLDGITLKQYMRSKGALCWKESLYFSTEIAKALSHAHSKGIVHRDIKPQNIIVTKDGSIKVTDFGIAHLENESNPKSETVGSIHYISPEQARGEPADVRSDIYSLGIVMYEMLTGNLPYEGDSTESIAIQHINSMLTLPGDINPDIPVRFEQITLKAMTAGLNDRYLTADELLNAIEEFRKEMNTAESDEIKQSVVHKPIKARKLRKYNENNKQSSKVSTLTGVTLIGIFLVAIVVFLWNFWFKDIFAESQRVDIPNFIGQRSEDLVNSEAYADLYNFHIVYIIDQNYREGIVIDQSPKAERSIVPGNNGIDIELSVSTGLLMTEIPNVVNKEYREATLELEKLGFMVEIEIIASDSTTIDYVVSTNPEAGQRLPAGATIYVNVSGGTNIEEVTMPNLVGNTKINAVNTLNSLDISIGSISSVSSSYDKGIIIWQNVKGGEKIAKGSVVYLQISEGVETIPTPSPTLSPSPSTMPSPTISPDADANEDQ